MSFKQIEDALKLTNDKVAKNATIISNKDINQNFMLHISSENMSGKKYIPRISERQNPQEDRTLPRITVAPTIQGCLVGYAKFLHDAFNYYPGNEYLKNYKQGVYIHEIEFEHCIKPSNKLVYDSSRSDEHWLITYNEETKEYKGKLIGKMFVSDINMKLKSNSFADINYIFYVAINKEEGIKLSKNIFLKKGYYKITDIAKDTAKVSWDKDKDFKVKEISKIEYQESKNLSAVMLSHVDEVPNFTKW